MLLPTPTLPTPVWGGRGCVAGGLCVGVAPQGMGEGQPRSDSCPEVGYVTQPAPLELQQPLLRQLFQLHAGHAAAAPPPIRPTQSWGPLGMCTRCAGSQRWLHSCRHAHTPLCFCQQPAGTGTRPQRRHLQPASSSVPATQQQQPGVSTCHMCRRQCLFSCRHSLCTAAVRCAAQVCCAVVCVESV